MNSLNAKQKMMFNFIKDTIDERGIAPSVREIGAAVGLKSTSSVQYNLNALENAGYIVCDANLKRTIRISSQDNARHIPLVGTVTAGRYSLSKALRTTYRFPQNPQTATFLLCASRATR